MMARKPTRIGQDNKLIANIVMKQGTIMSNMQNSIMSNRRKFIGMGIGAGLVLGARPLAAAEIFPIIETQNGKLRGLMSGGVSVFKGVRYGAPTDGRNRFMPPQAVKKWRGIKDALHYSDVAPQIPPNRRHDYADLIMVDLQPSGPGEDNLALNIWSPDTAQQAKNPVIVVLHGGGFYGGSGNSTGMDGERMARYSNSVVVSVTHRLGALGFLHLAQAGGDRFSTSGSVGMQDIVAALGWVQKNISEFGGDPSRVLVYGQSGGGAKTSAVLAMPKAKGLFHRAGVMSGSALRMMPEETANANAARLMKALDLGNKDVRRLQMIPWTTLLQTQSKLEAADRAKGEAPRSFAPVVDGIEIPRHPFDPDAPEVSKHVPMIVSTVLDERAYRMINFDMTKDELLKFATKRAGQKAQTAIDMYQDEDPMATPYLIAARMDSDLWFRPGAFKQAELKAAQGGAPVWTYLWKWPSPAYGGRYGAVHGIDVSPSLHNIRGALNGQTAESLQMADKMASTWGAFAAKGNSNHDKLPTWPAYEQKNRSTMIMDKTSKIESDPRAEFRVLWQDIKAARAKK